MLPHGRLCPHLEIEKMKRVLAISLALASVSAFATSRRPYFPTVTEAMASTIAGLPFSEDINADRWEAERSLSRTMGQLKADYPREELRGQLKKTSCQGEGRYQKCVSWEISID